MLRSAILGQNIGHKQNNVNESTGGSTESFKQSFFIMN